MKFTATEVILIIVIIVGLVIIVLEQNGARNPISCIEVCNYYNGTQFMSGCHTICDTPINLSIKWGVK